MPVGWLDGLVPVGGVAWWGLELCCGALVVVLAV